MLPLPLSQIRVLDAASSAAGAYASQTLADYGAEVIVAERPGEDRAAIERFGRSKFTCAIDSGTNEGVELLLQLGAQCHVVLRDSADAATVALNYDSLRARREDVVLVAVEGEGDVQLGEMTACAVMTALFEVRFRGRGQEVTVSAAAVAQSLRSVSVVATSAGADAMTPDLPGSGRYACGDSAIAIGVRGEDGLAALNEVTGGEIAAWAATKTADEAAELLNGRGIAAQRVLSTAELKDDPHLRARGVIEPVAAGMAVMEADGPRVLFGGTPLHTRWPVPAAGEHSDFVLRSIIGLPDADIGRLAASAVVKLPDTGAE